ncbi:MAG TPA: class I tRNA ligase family protein, partial [Terriglobales bacterium]|nr:class I tRNA ligase family protein [Terriglobales bacterium]
AGNGGPSLAGRAIEAVRSGEIRFTPENYQAIYLNWMENIYDWCISRQLWWGHRIPAWHCADCQQITVARQTPAKCSKCGSSKLEQDPDVLDTWFSSALLPFTTLGWPIKTPDLDVFYPTSLLITGFDILFFWVARMIMMGCHFMADHAGGSVPFREVYIHALVRDAERQKMSKTKGNVLDPIEVTEKYGTDAVRFTLAAMASPGTDIAFNEERTDGYRFFANKIWNAARFIFMNVTRAEAAGVFDLSQFQGRGPAGVELRDFHPKTLEDRWILSRFNRVAQQVDDSLSAYRFHDAASQVYQFFWGEFCDWYIEIVKPRLTAGMRSTDAEKATSRAAFNNLVTVFEASLRLLSPFMPFLTEELWHALYDSRPPLRSIALAAYPQAQASAADESAEREVEILRSFVTTVRELRAKAAIPPKEAIVVKVHAPTEKTGILRATASIAQKLANISQIEEKTAALDGGGWHRSTPDFDVQIVYERKVDPAAERERLAKELARLQSERANIAEQLANQRFISKAPANVVEHSRKRAAELVSLIAKAEHALKELGHSSR